MLGYSMRKMSAVGYPRIGAASHDKRQKLPALVLHETDVRSLKFFVSKDPEFEAAILKELIQSLMYIETPP